jgi:MoxR-like ATPase
MREGGPYRLGQRFGDYVLEEWIGAGAFKNVYRARNEGAAVPEPIVALGFPHLQDPDGLAELEKEFAVGARLEHPGILRVHRLERREGICFLVMEYLEGASLRQRLREQPALPPDEALRYAGLVSEALAYAHERHVLHRDVKPENIFLTRERQPKLLDFGIARILRTTEKASTAVGTFEYMAPEQFQGAAGTNADLWALGITLYEMLAGRRPFTGDATQVFQQIVSRPPDEDPLVRNRIDTRIVRVLRKLLKKDPEERYQSAEELARDLESIARKVRLVDDDEGRLGVLIQASYPLIYVYSFEEDRVLAAVHSIAARLGEERRRPRKVCVWSASRGLRDEAGKLVRPDTVEDPTAAILHAIENPEDAIYVFLDMHHHFTPVTTRLLRDAARIVRRTFKSVLFVSPFPTIPDELRSEVTLAVFQLPDRQQLEPLVERLAAECREQGAPVTASGDDLKAIARAALGLTMAEAGRAVRAAVVEHGALGPEAVRTVVEQKTQIIRKTGILEYYHGSESFADVGGLDALMEWFQSRAALFSGSARFAGLNAPKGVLLAGVPGCGKSLSARALAGAWGVPLLRLDVGRIFGGIVGASEANVRRAIQTAEAVSPCVLWIDEVEKGFAGVQSHSGGGVSARVFGEFLNWLQDKRSPVFVVATANDLSRIPPEFLRSGRFDAIFFVGLPDPEQRAEILRIHLRRRNRDAARFDLPALVAASDRFSGAELEEAVVSGLYRAFNAGRDLETADVQAEMLATTPLAVASADNIRALMAWAGKNARPASRPKEPRP